MILEKLQAVNFKNIRATLLEFSPGINCFLGRNGMGKSNLLEAIHFLSLARGLRTLPDSELITHSEKLMLLRGDYLRDDGTKDEISVGLTRGKRKILRCNGKEYPRLADHIGRFPVVVTEPRDTNLVSGAADGRRRLLDIVISQADKVYLGALMRYNKALDSRNRMLKSGMKDSLLFESVEQPLAEASAIIHNVRKDWVERSIPLFSTYYSRISGQSESAAISYKSALNDEPLTAILERARQKDAILGFTSSGVHRDDIEITLDGYDARRLGSQGQIKSLTLALKFAIYDWLCTTGGETPLLLLDDIFDKLDSRRVGNIMEIVSTSPLFAQIFVTDTNRQHLDEIVSQMPSGCLTEVFAGEFTPIRRP